MKKITLIIFLLSCLFSTFSSAIDVFEFDHPKQAIIFYELTKVLRCPKCQNQNIADSNAEIAKDLRQKTYQLVRAGKSKEEVLDYMVARFGHFVRYDPPVTPVTIILWLGPLLFVFIGFLVLYKQAHKKTTKKDVLSDEERRRLQKILSGDKR